MRRVVFMGEKPLGLRCLKLLDNGPDVKVVGVCTRLDGDTWWDKSEFVDYCEARGLPILKRAQILDQPVDYLISVLYPFIVEETYINHAREGTFNLHEAPLPRWRGCNDYSHAILSGDSEYGSTLHEMAPALDAGRIIAERSFPILLNETAGELYRRTSEQSYELAREWFPRLMRGDYASYDACREKESFRNARDSLSGLKEVAPEMPIMDVFRVARALDFVPWEPAFVVADSRRFYLFVADAVGRRGRDLPDMPRESGVSCLADLDWAKHPEGFVIDLPRPLVACESSLYAQLFPVFGSAVEAVRGV